jgi:hypothetical protein
LVVEAHPLLLQALHNGLPFRAWSKEVLRTPWDTLGYRAVSKTPSWLMMVDYTIQIDPILHNMLRIISFMTDMTVYNQVDEFAL